MRPLWTGAISFGLVNIPVGLYPATNSRKTVDFDLLRDSDHSRIRYRKVAEADGQEVAKEHIVKGYEYEKSHYVIVTEDDFKRVQIASNQVVDIKEFVELEEIDPRYFDQPYFLAPGKGGDKAYSLLRTALEKTGLAGIAKVVIRPPREHLALIKPLDHLLIMQTLHFADELRNPAELTVPRTEVGEKEMNMAVSLVQTMQDEWAPEKYKDEYREALMAVIEQKIKTGAVQLPAAAGGHRGPQKIIDLVALLQESIGEKQQKGQKTARKSKPAPARQKLHRKAA